MVSSATPSTVATASTNYSSVASNPVAVPSANLPLWGKLIRTKPIAPPNDGSSGGGLHKSLTAMNLIMFGVSAMIGTGIFVLTGEAASTAAGPALMISIVITGILCGFCALCYSELAAMIPVSGSAYSYLYAGLGEFAAWITGWVLIVEYLAGVMAIGIGWGEAIKHFFANLLHVQLPLALTTNTIEILEGTKQTARYSELVVKSIPFKLPFLAEHFTLIINQSFNFLPFGALLVVTFLLCRGIEENAKIASAMVYVKTAVILLFIVSAVIFLFSHPQILQQNWFANGWKTFAPWGWDGIFKGSALMFFAYIGFDALATASEEAKNPQRDLPVGILGSLIICTILYILVTVAVTAILPLGEIAQHKEAAVVHAMSMMKIPVADWLVSIGAIVGITSVLLVMQLASVRISYAIARDGLLPKSIAKLHPKLGVPLAATLIIGILNAFGSAIMPISLMAHISNLGTLFAFMMVCLAVVVLRITAPNALRPFRIPAGTLIGVLGFLGCLKLMLDLSATAWVLTGVLTLMGIAFYFLYGIKNSTLNQVK